MQKLEEINVVLYLILSVVTFGLFYFYWQYRQMKQCNLLLGSSEHGMLKWLFLSLITLGIYHFYHEYLMSKDIIEIQERFAMKTNSKDYPLLCLIISIFGFILVSDFIHQEDLNKVIRKVNSERISLPPL